MTQINTDGPGRYLCNLCNLWRKKIFIGNSVPGLCDLIILDILYICDGINMMNSDICNLFFLIWNLETVNIWQEESTGI